MAGEHLSLEWYVHNKARMEQQLHEAHDRIRQLEMELEAADGRVDTMGDERAQLLNALGVADDEDAFARVKELRRVAGWGQR